MKHLLHFHFVIYMYTASLLGLIKRSWIFLKEFMLSLNKSANVDFMGPHLLKLYLITSCVQKKKKKWPSLNTGVFPDCLKWAKVMSIYKQGNKADPSNYRQISILPTISKFRKIHIMNQICHYTSELDLLNKSHSGLRNFTHQNALTKLTDSWLQAMDKGNLAWL